LISAACAGPGPRSQRVSKNMTSIDGRDYEIYQLRVRAVGPEARVIRPLAGSP
jgi:hypothetical protein